MFFVASKAAWLVTAPSTLLLLCAVAGIGLGSLARWRRLGTGLAAASLIGVAAAAFSPAATLMERALEDRFPQRGPAPWEGAPLAGIVVLGGGLDARLSFARGQVQLNEAGDRLVAFAALARRYPGSRLIVSGGSGELRGDGSAEAEAVRFFADALGLDPARIAVEAASRNTRENAAFTAALVHPRPGERWLLVTSAAHMPRAVGCFRRAGFTVEAYPVDYRTPPNGAVLRTSLGRGLAEFDEVAREWIGLVAYRAAGYTDALLPGP